MAITLRETAIDTSGKATELSYQEMNNNLKSYYYSSSLSGNTLDLHFLSGSTSHSIDLSGISNTDTNIANTSLNLTGNRTLDLATNNLSIDVLQGETFSVTADSSATVLFQMDDGDFKINGLPNTETPLVVGYNSSTGVLSYYSTASFEGGSVDTGSLMVTGSVNNNTLTFTKGDGTTFALTVDTGSGGGSTSPGGSDTQVQFNDGGSFGGDNGFVYNKTSNKLTVVSAGTGATTTPTIQLGTSDVSIAPGDTVGRVSFANDDSTYGGDTSYAAIYAVAPSNWGGGQYPKDVRIAAVASAATVDVATFKGSGVVQLHDYGSGNNTGTAAKYLAVDSSGNVIEENVPSSGGLNIARPGSIDKNITFIEIQTPDQVTWDLHSTSGVVPPSAHVSTDSSTVSLIDEIKIHHTADFTGSFSGDIETALDQLAQGGDITIADSAELNDTATATVMEVVNNGSYHSIYTTAWNSSGLTSLSGVTGLLVGFDTDKLIELDDKNYNRIQVDNDVANGTSIRFRANSAASAGDYYVVEITAASSNSNNMLLEYVFNTQNSQETYVESTNTIYYHNNAATLTQLNINSTYQQAIIEFRVTPNGNLALMGADKVLR